MAPIKSLSIPRLELCGAQLLTQLMAKVAGALEMNIRDTYYWTDSTIVLNWIRATNKKLPVFVAHRIGEIQDTIAVSDWHHIGSGENPADLVSRGLPSEELMRSQLWWHGPQWLQNDDSINHKFEIPELDESQLSVSDRSSTVAVTIQRDVDPFDKYSTYGKLIRVVATCLRVARICRKEGLYGPSTVEELNHAIKCLVRREQRLAFLEDINALKKED